MAIKQSTLPETNMVPGKQIAVDCKELSEKMVFSPHSVLNVGVAVDLRI